MDKWLEDFIESQEDLDPEFVDIVNENFWDLLEESEEIKARVYDEENKLVGSFTYIEWLDFRIKYLKMILDGKAPDFYVENQYGGRDRMNEYGNTVTHYPFAIVPEKYKEIVDLQMEIRGNKRV